jgi:hypothetical protein
LAVEEEENPQVRRMSKQSLREIPSKKGIPFEAFDYGPPVRNVEFFKRRCEELKMSFPDNVYELMYLHDTLGIHRKEYRAILKRQARRKKKI